MKQEIKAEQISFFNKSFIRFVEDDTSLCEDFKKDSIWQVWKQTSTHYIILHKNCFYEPFKEICEVYMKEKGVKHN